MEGAPIILCSPRVAEDICEAGPKQTSYINFRGLQAPCACYTPPNTAICPIISYSSVFTFLPQPQVSPGPQLHENIHSQSKPISVTYTPMTHFQSHSSSPKFKITLEQTPRQ